MTQPREGPRGPAGYADGPRWGGVVRAVLPNGRFEVELEDGSRVRAHRGRSARMDLVRVIGGARVEVERLALDPSRARIVGLAKPD